MTHFSLVIFLFHQENINLKIYMHIILLCKLLYYLQYLRSRKKLSYQVKMR